MGLRSRPWRRFLSAPDPELLTELYEPALRAARRYDRCCAYFSSTVLAVAVRGFAPLLEWLLEQTPKPGKPPIRLLVNEELSRADVDAMLHGRGADELAERLASRLIEPRDALEKERLALLGMLVKKGLLEVRVGVMRSGRGILHAKFGIVEDEAGDSLVFSGSGNESAQGLIANYEELEVTGSWEDATRDTHFRSRFEELWNGHSPQVDTLSLPRAVRDRLIRYANETETAVIQMRPPLSRREHHEAWMRWRFALEAAWFPDGGRNCDALAPDVGLWQHQVRVVEECSAAWPAGRLLCDEVGMGKTIEAIMILRRLLAGRGVRRALLLVPAGIVRQWQDELREKGGLLVPRLEGQSTLVWPDERVESVSDLAAALQEPLLLVSREMARLEQNADIILKAPRWDLVLLDEAHAARRASQVETEFNSATLLLELLRKLQLEARARSVLLLSATPMQTHPWEPWDLLATLGEGAPWLSDFGVVRAYYEALAGAVERPLPVERGRLVADTVRQDPAFPSLSVAVPQIPTKLLAGSSEDRRRLVAQLRSKAPLGRRMHRNTRQTLHAYHRLGLLEKPPAKRHIQDVRYDFADPDERALYEGIQSYVERRFAELEAERPGKGFVMTVYRRRAASSPLALRRSLERRKHGLEVVARGAAADALDELEASDRQDMDEALTEFRSQRGQTSLPEDPKVATLELRDVALLLERLDQLQHGDSKFEQFRQALGAATNDGRPCLVFSEFTDTVEYLRDTLYPSFGSGVACYTGEGGTIYEGDRWRHTSKEDITARLDRGEIRVLLCSDAASEGLNLQVAGALINYDLPWNPARVEQRIGRIDRIGQKADLLRIANLVLADSVDENVYRVLSQRCDIFRNYVGAMQPVLSVARRMLLGVQPFNEAALEQEAVRAGGDVVAQAAFEATEEVPPAGPPAGVTINDLVRAHSMLQLGDRVDFAGAPVPLRASWKDLEADLKAVPLSPLQREVRAIGTELVGSGELLPLVIEAVDEGSFRSAVAVWAGEGGSEVVDRAERLEALLGMWNGTPITAAQWKEAHGIALDRAKERVRAMSSRAQQEELAGLECQVAAARIRLLRQLARFLACANGEGEDWNVLFHLSMQRGGQVGALLTRAHGLVGYPDWPEPIITEAVAHAARLSANQRKNLMLGTPLEAAVSDPRWRALDAIAKLTAEGEKER